jgi:ATP-binding cassette subfamily B protein
MMQRLGVRAPILLTGGIIITLMMDSFLALTMILMLPLIFVTVLFITRRGIPLYTKVQQASDRMIGVVREDVQGIRVIKALSKGEYEHRRYDNVNKELSDSERKVGRVMGAVNPVMNLFMNFGLVAVVALSANRVAGNLSDPETVVAFIQYFTMISMAMISITRMFNMFTRALASSKRINEVLETEEEIKTTEQFTELLKNGKVYPIRGEK